MYNELYFFYDFSTYRLLQDQAFFLDSILSFASRFDTLNCFVDKMRWEKEVSKKVLKMTFILCNSPWDK
jgi:hypothetical protein